jgi:PEP-CTERM motif-containing protein
MNMFKTLAASAAMAMVMVGAGAAQATTLVSNLTIDGSAHGLGGTSPYGQVSVNDAGGTLAFTVTLFDGLKFGATSGAADSFAFNVGVPTWTTVISNISDNGSGAFTSGGGATNSPFGSFNSSVDCYSGCSSDSSNSTSVLTFKVSDYFGALTVDDLTKNSSGDFFSAYVINSRGVTGDVGANSLVSSAAAAVPEPATWLIMLLGFSGLGAALRYRRQQGLSVA